ncbi:terpenoid synthase [Trametopsis cervina]|nr:terpenoid synthase [Trametopsis cervina]
MSDKQSQPISNVKDIGSVLMDFLARVESPIEPHLKADPSGAIEGRVREEAQSWAVTGPRFEKHLRTGVDMSTIVYYQNSIDAQVDIACYTTLLLTIDDFNIPVSAMEEFTTRLLIGAPQLHPSLEYLVGLLRRMTNYFPIAAEQNIATSTLNFIHRTLFDVEQADSVLSKNAGRYVVWARLKDGIGEAYAFFIWERTKFPATAPYAQTIPDIDFVLGHINDLFSFYKEELAGEYNNSICRRAQVMQLTIGEALAGVAEEVLQGIGRVRANLTGEEKETWERFLSKYLTFHCLAPRYRLSEIITF